MVATYQNIEAFEEDYLSEPWIVSAAVLIP
jgi:hypothetical protein